MLLRFLSTNSFSNLSNADEIALVANLGKTCLAKGTARYNSVF